MAYADFCTFATATTMTKASASIKSIFLRRPYPKSECCKRGQKLGNDDDFASYIDLPDVQRWKAGFRSLPKRKMDRLLLLATIKETASASSIGNMSRIAGSDTCPLFYPPELHISYASSSKWCGSKGGKKEVERKLSGENLLCLLCHDKLDQDVMF